MSRKFSPRNLKDDAPVWPLPVVNGHAPTIVDRRVKMPGVHIAYEWGAPRLVPVFAVADGFIVYAGKQPHGHTVILDHRNGWATYYTNLEHMFAASRTTGQGPEPKVKAGDVLGFIDTKDRGGEQCLYFELWRRGEDCHFSPENVNDYVHEWSMLPWSDKRKNPSQPESSPAVAA